MSEQPDKRSEEFKKAYKEFKEEIKKDTTNIEEKYQKRPHRFNKNKKYRAYRVLK